MTESTFTYSPAPDAFRARALDTMIGGQPAVMLEAPAKSAEETPRIVRAVILPGRGMNVYQLTAHLPFHGLFDMLYAPPLAEAAAFFDNGPEDFMGNRSFMVGGAILVPYPNRMRGRLLADGKSIETPVLGTPVILPANWSSAGNTGGEKVAMHGLMLKTPAHHINLGSNDEAAWVSGAISAGDFDGRWIGDLRITTTATLGGDGFSLAVTVENTGTIPSPVAIGWHPYFELPGKDREQVRLRIPARQYVPVNNYDDVFPTGAVESVTGTPFDFRRKGGVPLGDRFFDDSFTGLAVDDSGTVPIEIIDPAANYGVAIRAGERNRAVQLYAPPDKNFVAIEPQFNLTDPCNEDTWGRGANRGMELLAPGRTVAYNVQVGLFVPEPIFDR